MRVVDQVGAGQPVVLPEGVDHPETARSIDAEEEQELRQLLICGEIFTPFFTDFPHFKVNLFIQQTVDQLKDSLSGGRGFESLVSHLSQFISTRN